VLWRGRTVGFSVLGGVGGGRVGGERGGGWREGGGMGVDGEARVGAGGE